MNQVILASHGGLAAGALDTVHMIVGDAPNVHAVSLLRDDKEPITSKVERLVSEFDPQDSVYVLTDMLGSSVNNSIVEYQASHPDVTVIAGMNMPMILTLTLSDKRLDDAAVRDLVAEGRRGIVDCAHPDAPAQEPQAQAASRPKANGGPAKIVLTRLDYRLLHGQVVFSWVSKVGAERIIVVDDATANDEVRKGALRLAKPAGVRLNVFTVDRALKKMAKLNTLGEKVMFVFGSTSELRRFYESYRLGPVNLGATANHDGAQMIGGKGSSVFLDDAQKADVNALLDMGVKIFVQQTPALPRVDVTERL
ncbi:MAG: PTS mannose/fructose/sorbose transporter subunit IIAB [Coriobacteriaceae bacterium]|jgi:mannose PTS system EIIAB component|nr:PTS sugar transporter subunit IIB [Olsenella sp.]RRF89167.1 MAG: PTS mannose/fructose/sorbose transporter subunit IIAB [Coriobacteriaceae bacterium]